jgi:hypothetical protein
LSAYPKVVFFLSSSRKQILPWDGAGRRVGKEVGTVAGGAGVGDYCVGDVVGDDSVVGDAVEESVIGDGCW